MIMDFVFHFYDCKCGVKYTYCGWVALGWYEIRIGERPKPTRSVAIAKNLYIAYKYYTQVYVYDGD